MTTESFTSGSLSTSWVCPAGVTEVVVEGWSATCGSEGGTALGPGGGGGYGATYARSVIAVTPGQTYTVVRGAKGTGAPYNTSGQPTHGGPSQFLGPSSEVLWSAVANGAGSVLPSQRNGGVPSSTGSVADVVNIGDSGGTANNVSASSGGQGGNAGASTGGSAGVSAGTGGDGGVTGSQAGKPGTDYGGGPGGGRGNNSSGTGIEGKDGAVFLTYSAGPSYTPKFKSVVVGGTKKTTTDDDVILSGVKKDLSSVSVLIGGVKKPVV